ARWLTSVVETFGSRMPGPTNLSTAAQTSRRASRVRSPGGSHQKRDFGGGGATTGWSAGSSAATGAATTAGTGTWFASLATGGSARSSDFGTGEGSGTGTPFPCVAAFRLWLGASPGNTIR